MNVVRDQEFRIYRCYQIPTFTEANKTNLSSLVAQYLYIKYAAAKNPFPKYTKADDIDVLANSAVSSLEGVQLSHLSLKHALASHLVVFIEHKDQYLALVRSPTPLFLVQALESLDMEPPLILSPLKASTAAIQNCFNGYESLGEHPGSLGDVEFVFAPRMPLEDSSLKEIVVEIPSRDLKEITTKIGSSLSPMERVFEWLGGSTTLRFENLEMRGLRCALAAISVDRLKIAGSTSDDLLARMLAVTVDGLLMS